VVFGRLLGFLNRLDQANAWYRLDHTRPGSLMVEIALPGWRLSSWLIERSRSSDINRSLAWSVSRSCWRSSSRVSRTASGERYVRAIAADCGRGRGVARERVPSGCRYGRCREVAGVSLTWCANVSGRSGCSGRDDAVTSSDRRSGSFQLLTVIRTSQLCV
jgi:hypothetical protein